MMSNFGNEEPQSLLRRDVEHQIAGNHTAKAIRWPYRTAGLSLNVTEAKENLSQDVTFDAGHRSGLEPSIGVGNTTRT